MMNLPNRDMFRVLTEGYPVDGDRVAEAWDDPTDKRPTRRLPVGDLLWSQPGVVAS